MTTLPKSVPFDADGVTTWNLLRSAEKAASKEIHPAAKYRDHLVDVRVLGFFLLDLYHHSGVHRFGLIPYKRLLLEVKSCFRVSEIGDQSQIEAAQHAKIFELGLSYRNNLMRVFRFNSGPMSVASSCASRPSFDQARLEMIKKMQNIENSQNTISEVRSAALFRDGFKCMITGGYDLISCKNFPELQSKALARGAVVSAECAHIFPESARDANKPSEYAATAFTMLRMFGQEHEVNKLLGKRVNSLSNVLTLRHELHQAFERFDIWLEEVPGKENTYKVVIADSQPLLRMLSPPPPEYVTFSVDPDWAAHCEKNNIPLPTLPSRDLIAIRAACARVANMSGAAEQIDQICRDEEDIMVMASDGSTGDLLTSLLNVRAVSVGA